MKHSKNKNLFIRFVPLIILCITVFFGTYFLKDYLNFETLAKNHDALYEFRDKNYALALGFFILIYVVIVSFGLPGATVATLTGGFLFGVFPGALYNATAATLGALGIFLAVRWGVGASLEKRIDKAGGRMHKIKKGIDENQWSMLFFIRFVPIVPFFVANLLPAFFGVSLFRYAVSTFLGIIPGTVVYTSVGAGLSGVISRGESPDLSVIFSWPILLPILGLAMLSLLPMIIKYLGIFEEKG